MPVYKRIDHVALHVADLDRSIAFYEGRFGCHKYYEHRSSRGMRIAYLRLGDTVLELVDRADGPMTGFHFCFETDDFDGAVAELEAAGVPCLQPPHHTDAREAREAGWRRVVFRGPDGESIELRG